MLAEMPVQTSRPYDAVIEQITDYVLSYKPSNQEALSTARYCLMDTLGCGLLALQYPACRKLLGPLVPGAELANGVRVPGTKFRLDPVQGAFNIGCMIRWLDYNDTWLAAEWGHPSDNLGGILACCDYLAQQGQAITMKDVLAALIQAHEIQGVLALQNSFNRVGLDHVILVKVASTAVCAKLLGCTREQILAAVSHAWLDGQALRTYRHAPNTGSRKSWAAGDATSRAVRLALIAKTGEMGYPTALSAKTWGFSDVLFKGKQVVVDRPFADYVMTHVLFKISFPAEFHAQTAVEAAITLHKEMATQGRTLADIKQVHMGTHESAIRIIDKKGPLHNFADRDHCLQYMTAIGLIFGHLTADHYEDAFAKDARIDALRDKMHVTEVPEYSRDYLDPAKRSIANRIQLTYTDGTTSSLVAVEYPIGHKRRRAEGIPHLIAKFAANSRTALSEKSCAQLEILFADMSALQATPVEKFCAMLV